MKLCKIDVKPELRQRITRQNLWKNLWILLITWGILFEKQGFYGNYDDLNCGKRKHFVEIIVVICCNYLSFFLEMALILICVDKIYKTDTIESNYSMLAFRRIFMLSVYHRLQDLDFTQLMGIYSEGNKENAVDQYAGYDLNVAILNVEQDFYCYLKDVFFLTPGAFYAVWQERGIYFSALRMEPYRDGLLLEALETHPERRKRGYAKKLISAVLEQLKDKNIPMVYAHIHKRNLASLRTHLSCGFSRISELAIYIDGSINDRCCTMQYRF